MKLDSNKELESTSILQINIAYTKFITRMQGWLDIRSPISLIMSAAKAEKIFFHNKYYY